LTIYRETLTQYITLKEGGGRGVCTLVIVTKFPKMGSLLIFSISGKNEADRPDPNLDPRHCLSLISTVAQVNQTIARAALGEEEEERGGPRSFLLRVINQHGDLEEGGTASQVGWSA
jgi:hypothetical protein